MLVWIILFPLLGFLINSLWYLLFQIRQSKPANAWVTGGIASIAIFCSFLVSVLCFFQLSSMPHESRLIQQELFSWIEFANFKLSFALHWDPLSSLFALVITGVGTLIHIYSIGYMGDDATPGKYFAYLNLFCFAMLVLVLGASLPVTFLGWEGVGLCSYLLIGYWYEDDEKASAGKKAFVVNRIGDLGFLLGMFLIYSLFGTLDYLGINQAFHAQTGVNPGLYTFICLLLFLGCAGKSAQIPLYVWLPDAMAGPTPVSALIHAATMVTSGVYLVSRLNYLYTASPDALQVVAWIGVATALLAATIAIVQTDIKKVLAYSTVSQLGYMFLACGVGAYTAGVFHVITHAFFKALLFLGAGSVIYGMHHEQDIMKMGGLRTKMPQTTKVFAIATLAICGVPIFSGFFSKDEILWKAMSSPFGSTGLWVLASVTAVMTAFYMTRLFVLTFLGEMRTGESHQGHHGHDDHHGKHGHHPEVHESPNVMLYPLYVLAFLSAVGGFLGFPHFHWLEHWLGGIIPEEVSAPVINPHLEWGFMLLSVLGAALGIGLAFRLYTRLSFVQKIKQQWHVVHGLLSNKWYVDELYDRIFVRPLLKLSQWVWKGIDVSVIDRFVLSFGFASQWTGQKFRAIQTGSIQVYGVSFLIGLAVVLGYLIYGMV